MKKFFSPLVLAATLLLTNNTTASAQTSLQDLLNKVKDATGTSSNNSGNQSGTSKPTTNNNGGGILGAGLSNGDIASGLKEALKIGAQNASNKLSLTDGFFKNAAIKILMPAEVKAVESKLRSVGLGSLVDNAILKMNRAAESAAKQAAPIFVNAITSISINDGLSILKGGNNAATQYLQGKTTSALTSAFSPVIQKSLGSTGATTAWNAVFSAYNKFSKTKVNTNLTGYVTEKALSGLFSTIAQEELKIRTDPAAQVSSLLQKVFGGK
jgi:hypothetical protein